MIEMLEIIEKAREEYANDITDHTENEYIREALLNAGYRKPIISRFILRLESTNVQLQPDEYECENCGYVINYRTPYCSCCGAYIKDVVKGM